MGLVLVAVSFLMPLMFTVDNFGIFHTLYHALDTLEKVDLMSAALKLVGLNTLRAAPHYIGAFFIAESLEFSVGGRRNAWGINAILVVLILKCTYSGIDAVTGVHYDFGLPALMVVGMVLVFDKLDYKYIALEKKGLLITTGLAVFWFLDVMPAANRFPVGRGEISMEIKMASQILEADPTMNTVTIMGLVLFSVFFLMIFVQLRDENRLREMSALQEQNQSIRIEARLNEMKNRTYQEMQHLVHDLKSPLTVVQSLVGVIKIECESEGRTADLEYLNRIEEAVDRMSCMISEILYEDRAEPETVEKLVSRTMAQLSVEPYARYVQVELADPGAVVRVNRVLFPRALVNLIQNSIHAIPEGRVPEILLRVEVRDHWVRFQVRDNGVGIPKERQDSIWGRGYSGSGSSGLGLAFVQNVVQQRNGRVELESVPGQGTAITLVLPEEEREYEP